MPLTKKQILKIMDALQVKVVTEERGYIFARRTQGWSDDAELGPIQAKLSIMLEMAKD